MLGTAFFHWKKKKLLFKPAQFPLVHSILKGLSNDFKVLLTECCAKWGKSVSGQTQERKWLFLSVKFFNCHSQSSAQNTLAFHEDLGKNTITLCYSDYICFNWNNSEITVCWISVSCFHLQIKQPLLIANLKKVKSFAGMKWLINVLLVFKEIPGNGDKGPGARGGLPGQTVQDTCIEAQHTKKLYF